MAGICKRGKQYCSDAENMRDADTASKDNSDKAIFSTAEVSYIFTLKCQIKFKISVKLVSYVKIKIDT